MMNDSTPHTIASLMASLDDAQHGAILEHFDGIYHCQRLGQREQRIVYLAYLLKSGWLLSDGGWLHIHHSITEVSEADYELTDLETQGMAGGVNLLITIGFYGLDRLADLL
jgi:hypothetical protein